MNKLIELIKQHKIATAVAVYVLLMLIVVVTVIIVSQTSNRVGVIGTDPASQMPITTGPETNAAAPVGIDYYGFGELTSRRSSAWVQGVRAVIELYAREHNIELSRVSMVKDSFYSEGLQAESVDHFRIVLNVDRQEMNVSISMRQSFIDIGLYDLDNVRVYQKPAEVRSRFITNDNPLPSWLNIGPIITAKYEDFDSIPPFASDVSLPPIWPGDDVRVHFGCPLPNQTTTNGCYIYKYDFYF